MMMMMMMLMMMVMMMMILMIMMMMLMMMIKMMMMILMIMMMMRRPSSLRVRAKPRHLPYIYMYNKIISHHSYIYTHTCMCIPVFMNHIPSHSINSMWFITGRHPGSYTTTFSPLNRWEELENPRKAPRRSVASWPHLMHSVHRSSISWLVTPIARTYGGYIIGNYS